MYNFKDHNIFSNNIHDNMSIIRNRQIQEGIWDSIKDGIAAIGDIATQSRVKAQVNRPLSAEEVQQNREKAQQIRTNQAFMTTPIGTDRPNEAAKTIGQGALEAGALDKKETADMNPTPLSDEERQKEVDKIGQNLYDTQRKAAAGEQKTKDQLMSKQEQDARAFARETVDLYKKNSTGVVGDTINSIGKTVFGMFGMDIAKEDSDEKKEADKRYNQNVSNALRILDAPIGSIPKGTLPEVKNINSDEAMAKVTGAVTGQGNSSTQTAQASATNTQTAQKPTANTSTQSQPGAQPQSLPAKNTPPAASIPAPGQSTSLNQTNVTNTANKIQGNAPKAGTPAPTPEAETEAEKKKRWQQEDQQIQRYNQQIKGDYIPARDGKPMIYADASGDEFNLYNKQEAEYNSYVKNTENIKKMTPEQKSNLMASQGDLVGPAASNSKYSPDEMSKRREIAKDLGKTFDETTGDIGDKKNTSASAPAKPDPSKMTPEQKAKWMAEHGDSENPRQTTTGQPNKPSKTAPTPPPKKEEQPTSYRPGFSNAEVDSKVAKMRGKQERETERKERNRMGEAGYLLNKGIETAAKYGIKPDLGAAAGSLNPSAMRLPLQTVTSTAMTNIGGFKMSRGMV